jgi:signal transduction histidine kinase
VSRPQSRRPLVRLWPQRVRTRLAVLYALLFLAAGSSLLALTYGLLASRLPASSTTVKSAKLHGARLLALCKEPPAAKTVSDSLVVECKRAFAAGANAASHDQRDQTLSSLLRVSLIGLGITTLCSGGLGWVLSGRALRPVRAITETARRASELQLGHRLALTGPDDELKELADTFDQMLERLDAAFASQSRFVANAAHELRTPLTAMRTSIEVTLSKPSVTPEQLAVMAGRLHAALQRAEATIDALLTLAISERGPATQEPVDLATATEDALEAATAAIAELELRVDTSLQPARATGDRVLLDRMIANLVDNAVRHNNPRGFVQLHTGERDDEAFVEIENSGPYVAAEGIPLLFEPFGRGQQRLNPYGGIGLGLSIADAIGAAHGATFTTQSRPAGGLDICVALPRSDPAQTDSVAAAE